jgi:hypothetical protein
VALSTHPITFLVSVLRFAISADAGKLRPMPKLRSLPERAPTSVPVATELVEQPKNDGKFEKGHKRIGGREKGQQNILPRTTREAIREGLEAAGNTMGPSGIVTYVTQAALADFKFGCALLNMITPKTAHLDITRHDHTFVSISDLDAELHRQGLPASSEIFKLDYAGTPVEDDTAEVVGTEDTAKK